MELRNKIFLFFFCFSDIYSMQKADTLINNTIEIYNQTNRTINAFIIPTLQHVKWIEESKSLLSQKDSQSHPWHYVSQEELNVIQKRYTLLPQSNVLSSFAKLSFNNNPAYAKIIENSAEKMIFFIDDTNGFIVFADVIVKNQNLLLLMRILRDNDEDSDILQTIEMPNKNPSAKISLVLRDDPKRNLLNIISVVDIQ